MPLNRYELSQRCAHRVLPFFSFCLVVGDCDFCRSLRRHPLQKCLGDVTTTLLERKGEATGLCDLTRAGAGDCGIDGGAFTEEDTSNITW